MENRIIEIKRWLNKPRSWWLRRWISESNAENILEHSKKVYEATKIYGQHFPEIDMNKLLIMARYHDIAEYKEKDYMPWEISIQEKFKRELAVILTLKDQFNWRWCRVYEIWLEFEKWESEEAKIVKQLDILDPVIQALEYEKTWLYNVNASDFYEYAKLKLTDPILINILNILFKKDFPFIFSYLQYFILLAFKGDKWKFMKFMNEYLDLQWDIDID